MQKRINFFFIGDLLDFPSDEKFDLGLNCTLRRATLNEIPTIKDSIQCYLRTGNFLYNRYENELINERCSTISNPRNYCYSVIEFQPAQPENVITILEYALNLSLTDLTAIVYFSLPGMTGFYDSTSSLNFYNAYRKSFEKRPITNNEIQDLRQTIQLVHSFLNGTKNYITIEKALDDFRTHKEIKEDSPFKLVVLFSTLELLLTNGEPDRTTSINKQLQRKITLLNNRSQNPVNFRDYLRGPDSLTLVKVVESLYAYRSKVAHGDFIEFKKSLAVLENVDFAQVRNLLLSLTKMVVRQALHEPDLLVDLKQC